MRSGYVDLYGSRLRYAGNYGHYWSDRAGSSDNAYYLSFYPSSVSPSNGSTRYSGFSVRCVAGWE